MYLQHNTPASRSPQQNPMKNQQKYQLPVALFQKNYKKHKKNLQRRGSFTKMRASQVVAMENFFQLKFRRYIQ